MDSRGTSTSGSKRRVRGRNVENMFKNPSEPENQGSVHFNSISDSFVESDNDVHFAYMCRVAVNNKIGHSVTTPQSMIDQSVTPEQGITQFSKGVLHSGVAANLESNRMTAEYNNGMYSSSQTAEQCKNQFQRIISPNVPVKEHNSKNVEIQNINSSGNSSLIFSIPKSCVTTVHKQKCVKKKIVADSEEEQNHSKKFCGKLSPGPSSFNTANVKSTFEKGESSRQKNLMNEFNDVDENVTIDSDTTCGDMASDIEDIDEEYLSNNHSMWDGYLDLGAPDKICSKCDAVMWNHEKNNKSSPNKPPTFSLCCKIGQLYIYDTEDKINNMINVVNGGRDAINEEIVQSLLHILDEHNSSVSGRPNHIAPSNEVAGLIVTSTYAKGCRDTVIDYRVDRLQRIFEADPRFMQLQYPLVFPHGDIGYYREIPLNRPVKHSKRDVEVIESEDPDEKGLTPHLGGRLWQQHVVDAFTAIEQYRLDWIRDHQTTIRSDLYHNIIDAMQKGDRNPSNIGKAIILPASFTGSKRYMTQYFKDSLAICRTLGHPLLFLTMTTNTKWPEIQRMLKHMSGVDVADAPDVVARVFKMKVDQLIDMIKKKNCFGRCIGAEIPDPEIHPVGYNAVSNYMIHRPCGSDYTKSPCMVKGNWIKHFPKRYNSHTFFDECGFPIYRRRRTGITINKKGVNLDNRFVVPFNRDLLGHDTEIMCLRKTRTCTSATIPKKAPKGPIDEVKHYLDGRYVCTSEASWRIFAFDIHSRWPSVERLPINLPGEKHVSFKAGDVLEDVCDKSISKKTKKKGSRSFEDLKTVNGHIHETFKEACAALGLLQNDNQWHEAIAENFHTSLPPQLRAMFVNILTYSPISDPLRLWEANWQCGVFFVYGSGGCGKTFLWKTLCCRLHSEGKIVLPVASCGIVDVLLPGGRTTHSRFHISLKLDQDSTAGIRHGTDIAELIQQTDLFIWDEAPMQHRHAFKSIDRSLRDIMSAINKRRAKKPFGGITVVFGGD
ncbi:uncharacterized protein LOC141690844 [Apium graveolens]|uniref:uncharacterized protein LOC141690844 n=1 Tax=Apium graveolens TaxID=4045 RepID=UPI003D79A141